MLPIWFILAKLFLFIWYIWSILLTWFLLFWLILVHFGYTWFSLFLFHLVNMVNLIHMFHSINMVLANLDNFTLQRTRKYLYLTETKTLIKIPIVLKIDFKALERNSKLKKKINLCKHPMA